MYDSFNRKINYLRISVTDRCNLRCTYCMPAEGIKLISHKDILSFDEIVEITRFAVSQGVDKVRLTGGEPLVRRGIVSLVEMLANIKGIRDLSMTSNGVFLKKFAKDLKNAGLQRINISLDTLNAEKYKEITRVGDINNVLEGIDAAIDTDLKPVKLNCVVQNSSKEEDAIAVKKFAMEKNIEVRFIHQMNLNNGSFSIVEGGEGGHCESCNRLRLSANGFIYPCLFNDLAYSVRELGIEKAIELAVKNKPRSGTVSHSHEFYNIGG